VLLVGGIVLNFVCFDKIKEAPCTPLGMGLLG